jgi:glutathione S-transferase
VPTIHHLPSNIFLMDSVPIAAFIESTYPSPPVPLTSDLGRLIETNARSIGARAFRTAVMPREVRILSPRSQEYFRSKREAALGHRLEDLLDHEEEEWSAVDQGMTAQGELMLTNRAKGPFVLGEKPSYTDFFITGNLQSARVINEGVFQRLIKYPGYGEIYNACQPYMERKD